MFDYKIWPQIPLCRYLCNVPFPILPSGGRVYFSTCWKCWTFLNVHWPVTCLDQWTRCHVISKELSRSPAASSHNLLGPNCHVRKPKVAMWDFTEENQRVYVNSPKDLLDMGVRPLNTLHPICQSTSQLNMCLRVNETLRHTPFLTSL